MNNLIKSLFSISVFFFGFFFGLTSKAEVVDKIVAIVNNEIVTQSDLKAFQKKLNQQGTLDELLLLGKSIDELKKAQKEALEYLINEKIMDSEVKRLNLSVTIERVESEIREIAKKNGMTRADLLSAIKNQGLGAAEYQDFIKSRIERQSLIETEVSSKIRISDEDVVGQYLKIFGADNTASFEYTLAHIYFNPKKGGSDSAQERAKLVLKKLAAGEVFENLAEQHSEDSGFSAGGMLGTFRAGELTKEFDNAVSKLNIGDNSEVVKSKNGFHILRVLNKKIVSDARFEKEKEKIRTKLFEAAFSKNFKTWLLSKRDEAFLRYNSIN